MDILIQTGRIFFCIGMACMAGQQLYYGDFRPVFAPSLSSWIPFLNIWAYLFGAVLIVLCAAIVSGKNAKSASLRLGGLLLIFLLITHIPYEILVDPYSHRLGTWTNAFKELALSGSAFVVAGSFHDEYIAGTQKSGIIPVLENFIPFGKIFFSITLITFGICHFIYTEFVAILVPFWIPNHIFWTYVAGMALIGSGLSIILNIQKKIIVTLMGMILFIWFLILHIPRALASLPTDKGNQLTSVFQSLAFSGIALIIANEHVATRKRISK
ncbi:MAG: hypothetical protein ABIR66_11395 [Saprospiraceae bacterium]